MSWWQIAVVVAAGTVVGAVGLFFVGLGAWKMLSDAWWNRRTTWREWLGPTRKETEDG